MDAVSGIDVIVPAHRAHATLARTLESLAVQTIASELEVIVVDDDCPEGGYHDVVAPFFSRLNIRLVRLPRNLGPGGARQAGIDATGNPLFTCMDSDDAFARPTSLEQLRDAMRTDRPIQRCGGFLERFDASGKMVKRSVGTATMDGRLFRRSFVERYQLRFNGSRINEDYGYNLAVDLLCDNHDEKTYTVPEPVVHVHKNPSSITAYNDGQFIWDQRLCGLIDNSIWAFDLVKRYRPESPLLRMHILRMLIISYAYWCAIYVNAPEFADQAWEYVKKYYHTCYVPNRIPAYASMESKIRPETTGDIFRAYAERGFFQLPEGTAPPLSFDEFLERMRSEEYDPDHIYDVWKEMARSPEMRARMAANVEHGACEPGYTEKGRGSDT